MSQGWVSIKLRHRDEYCDVLYVIIIMYGGGFVSKLIAKFCGGAFNVMWLCFNVLWWYSTLCGGTLTSCGGASTLCGGTLTLCGGTFKLCGGTLTLFGASTSCGTLTSCGGVSMYVRLCVCVTVTAVHAASRCINLHACSIKL